MPAFDLNRIGAGLAFAEALPALQRALAAGPGEPAGPGASGVGASAVVQAPPGTGKTTLVPPAVANAVGQAAGKGAGRVIVTQPRRVAVRAAARRLAALDGSALGERVGYAVRGDRVLGDGALIEVVTPGLLLRRLLADPWLEGAAAVVVDEVHERGLDTDLLLGLLGEVREAREDLTLVAMSATLDAERFARLLGAGTGAEATPAPLVDSPAALYPLTVRYAPAPGARQDERGLTRAFLDHVAATSAAAHTDALAADPGTDALVFLPGAREVDEVVRRLASHPEVRRAGTEVLALHRRIGRDEQDRAVSGRLPGGPPRIVVSTALAESSLTVPGVRLVVDAGLAREPRRDAARGMQGLVTVPVSRAGAEQRAGRAARLGPGTVVRCYEERTLAAAAAQPTPEILTADLTQATLTLAAWGAPRGEGLRLPDAPPAAALADAEATLLSLDAVQEDGRITPAGRELAELPLHPRWGRALLTAAPVLGAAAAARAVAAATADTRPPGGDLARVPGEDAVRREAKRLERLAAGAQGGERTTSFAAVRADGTGAAGAGAAVGWVTALAWPERIARHQGGGAYLLASGTRAGLPAGTLSGAQWLAVAEVQRAAGRDAAGTGAVIRLATAIDEETALEAAGSALSERVAARFEDGRVRARRVRALGAIELASTPVRPGREEGAAAVAAALHEQGLGLLRFSEQATSLRNRLGFLHRELGEPWPDVREAALVERLDAWLGPELERLAAGVAAGGIDLLDPLRRLLPWPEASRMEELAPARLPLPSGNTAAVRYPEPGEEGTPVVACKLQECFGLRETPRLAQGRAPVLFHLLSPAGRPLAVTDDLAGFWTGAYAQVRAEMRGRYPKHPWPDDPLTATPTHLTKRRLAEG